MIGRTRFGWLPTITLASAIVILAGLLSPGLRSDLGQVAVFVSDLDATGIRDWLLSFGTFSPAVYFLIMVAQVIVNPIPAGPVTLAGALIFGVWEGLALSMAGSVVGSVLVFLAVRRWGKRLVIQLIGKQTFHKYVGKLDDKGWWVFIILLLPFMPDDAVCALAGLSAVPFGRFVVMMVVGRLPGTMLTALLASDVVTQSTAAWIVAGTILVVPLALGIAYRKRLESWLLRRASAEDHQ